MKISIITTTQIPCTETTGWGMEHYVYDLIQCLNKEGHEIILFACNGSEKPKKGELIICNSEEELLNYKDRFKNCDIVHDWSSRKLIADYCYDNNIKCITSVFNVSFHHPKYHKNIVCVSDIQRYFGLAGKSGFENTPWEKQVGYTGHLNDAKRVYLGIDTEKYKPLYLTGKSTNKEDYILYFNSWDYRKGVSIALDLAKAMGFKLVLAGSTQHPEHRQTFNELKPILDAMPNVQYFTDISNERKIELMQKAKAMLFPSLFHQPFAVVVIESLACGTPVITTNMGAMPELIKHGKTGFLCNNIQEFQQAINNVQNINISECRSDVLKRFTRKKMTDEYIKLYKMVVEDDVEW